MGRDAPREGRGQGAPPGAKSRFCKMRHHGRRGERWRAEAHGVLKIAILQGWATWAIERAAASGTCKIVILQGWAPWAKERAAASEGPMVPQNHDFAIWGGRSRGGAPPGGGSTGALVEAPESSGSTEAG